MLLVQGSSNFVFSPAVQAEFVVNKGLCIALFVYKVLVNKAVCYAVGHICGSERMMKDP